MVKFDKYVETTIEYAALHHVFDVKQGGSHNPKHVDEMVIQRREGKEFLPPYVDATGAKIAGRHGVQRERQFVGGENPTITVRQFPWTYDLLSTADQARVQLWSLEQDLNRPGAVVRQFATFADEYRVVQRSLKMGLTEEEIRETLRGKIVNRRITELLKKANDTNYNRVVAKARDAIKNNPTLSIKKAIEGQGGNGNDPQLVKAVGSKRKPHLEVQGPGGIKMRPHHVAAGISGLSRRLAKYGDNLRDAFLDREDGLAGITKSTYLKHLQRLDANISNLMSVVDDIKRRALAEMNVTSDALEPRKARAARAKK
jgi:hypothetical protein